MRILLILSLTSCLFISGCANLSNEDVGTVTGGVVGGLLGSQFGGGSGQVAATAGGALLGAFLGGNIGRTMDRQDQMEMRRALDTAPTGRSVRWRNPDNGYRYEVRPTRTYYHQHQPCREYTTRATIGGKIQQVYGTACRQADGSWRIVS